MFHASDRQDTHKLLERLEGFSEIEVKSHLIDIV